MDLALWVHCRSQCKPMTSSLPLSVSPTVAAPKPSCKIVYSFKKCEHFLQFATCGSTASLASDFYSWCFLLPSWDYFRFHRPWSEQQCLGRWSSLTCAVLSAPAFHSARNDSVLFPLPLSPPISHHFPPVIGINRSRNSIYSCGVGLLLFCIIYISISVKDNLFF